jgi:hypothetical protein
LALQSVRANPCEFENSTSSSEESRDFFFFWNQKLKKWNAGVKRLTACLPSVTFSNSSSKSKSSSLDIGYMNK